MVRSAVAANTEDEWVSYSASNAAGFKITISANDGAIAVESNTTGGDYGYDSYYPSNIKIDAKKGVIETRNEKGVAQVSAAGIFVIMLLHRQSLHLLALVGKLPLLVWDLDIWINMTGKMKIL